MSGVDKDKSYVLKFKSAGHSNVESKASKFLGGFKGPVWKSKCTKKEAGKECCFESSVKCVKVHGCDDEPARWDTCANWNVSCKKQHSGLTMGA